MGKGKRNRGKRNHQKAVEKRRGSDPASSHEAGPPPPPQPDRVQLEASWWSGPLPPPEALHGYSQVVKNGGERVFRMAERQSKHRRKIENRASWTEAVLRIGGWVSASAIGLLAVGGSFFLIYEGRTISGLSALFMSVAVLIGAFQGQKRRIAKGDQLSLDLPKSG